MPSATIKIFLVHGDPKRLRTAELSNWTGKAIAGPRSEFDSLIAREESSRSGVYFLTGVDPESGQPAVYIGEAESICDRVRDHLDRDFWNHLAFFVSKDENLTKAHIRYLEGRLIDLAKTAERADVKNSQGSGSKLPESDREDMEVFLEKILQLLPALASPWHRSTGASFDECCWYYRARGPDVRDQGAEGHRASDAQRNSGSGWIRGGSDGKAFRSTVPVANPHAAATERPGHSQSSGGSPVVHKGRGVLEPQCCRSGHSWGTRKRPDRLEEQSRQDAQGDRVQIGACRACSIVRRNEDVWRRVDQCLETAAGDFPVSPPQRHHHPLQRHRLTAPGEPLDAQFVVPGRQQR